ncbi:response regulator [Paradesertivirga mongoliensis]|uniref:Response regulator n=1 Tax=Paradesertivirga mongoliensis TaxID=2100740 RepID=A0ABW4ZQF4_9SPHI|nr:response regulator [Pedobacter mongoliensis]
MSISLMLVDDDHIQHKIIELMIKRIDIPLKYKAYSHAQAVLSFLIKHHKNYTLLPDLILLDLDMPEISGWDFLDIFEIFKQYFAKKVSIIILTSSVDPRDRERIAMYESVKGFYSKPFTQDALEDILESGYITLKKK